jgi:hypothetical protein
MNLRRWPILDRNLDSIMAVDNYTADLPSNPKVVGNVMVTFFWRDMIRDILPKGNNGTVLVFHNPCSPTFTYRIDGPISVYLGRGDHHDPKYDGMAVSSMLKNLEQFSSSNSKYTGPPLNDEYCPYTLITYPSAIMEASYVTNNPIYFTVGALLIFGFTSAVFLVYDYMVERRQQKVMSTAVRTNAIVAQLFPSVIRDRIYATEDGEASQKAYKLANSKSRLKSFLTDGTSTHHDETEVSGKNDRQGLNSAPIAELFPDTTVIFADVVGFTAWSSIRDPAQVRRDVVTRSLVLFGGFSHSQVTGFHLARNNLWSLRCHCPEARRVQGKTRMVPTFRRPFGALIIRRLYLFGPYRLKLSGTATLLCVVFQSQERTMRSSCVVSRAIVGKK